MINRQLFYDEVRDSLFHGKLTDGQVKGMEAIFDMANDMPVNQLAYVFATIYHEVDKTMQPIEEYGKGKNRTYGNKVKYSGKPYAEPNKVYYGRGLTQTTWYENYAKLTKANTHGWDFLNNPELCLELIPSAWATIYAMTTGLYTGKKLSSYITDTKCDYFNARRIINGTDKAEMIAGYANKFLAALT